MDEEVDSVMAEDCGTGAVDCDSGVEAWRIAAGEETDESVTASDVVEEEREICDDGVRIS